MKMLLAFACLMLVLQVNSQQYTTPVPILKQINRHNADGSYTYGYEGADKSFKIETKYADGEVQGKYGYVDDQGQVRTVEYGASRRGFEPQGTDINVAPPTLQSSNPYPLGPNDIDDGQYREDPGVFYNKNNNNRNTAPVTFPQNNNYQAPAPRPQWSQPQPARNYPVSRFSLDSLQQQNRPQWTPPAPPRPQYYNQPQPNYQPQPQYYNPPPPQSNYQQNYQPNYQQPSYNNNNNIPNNHHPAVRNIDFASGSYSIDYRK